MKAEKKIINVLLVLLSLQIGIVGILKIVGFSPLYQQLAELHISPSFGLIIGFIEAICVIGLWIKQIRGIALLILLLLVTSAIAVHVGANVQLTKAVPAFLSFIIISIILFLNNKKAVVSIISQKD